MFVVCINTGTVSLLPSLNLYVLTEFCSENVFLCSVRHSRIMTEPDFTSCELWYEGNPKSLDGIQGLNQWLFMALMFTALHLYGKRINEMCLYYAT